MYNSLLGLFVIILVEMPNLYANYLAADVCVKINSLQNYIVSINNILFCRQLIRINVINFVLCVFSNYS